MWLLRSAQADWAVLCQTQTRPPAKTTYSTPTYLEQIGAKSISAGVVHGDALCDTVVVTVCVCAPRTWVDPARGGSAGVELGWWWWGGGGAWMGWGVSLKSGFQLNPWLSSKRTRKMTEVHDMVRSPHPAKPFHFGPFVSLQFLIFMITLPDITPTSGPTTISHRQHPSRERGEKREKLGWTYKQGTLESRSQTPRFRRSVQHRQYVRYKITEKRCIR